MFFLLTSSSSSLLNICPFLLIFSHTESDQGLCPCGSVFIKNGLSPDLHVITSLLTLSFNSLVSFSKKLSEVILYKISTLASSTEWIFVDLSYLFDYKLYIVLFKGYNLITKNQLIGKKP